MEGDVWREDDSVLRWAMARETGMPPPPPFSFQRANVKLPEIPGHRPRQTSSIPANQRYPPEKEDLDDPLVQGRSKLYQRRKELEAELRREFELPSERAAQRRDDARPLPKLHQRRAPPPIPPIPRFDEYGDEQGRASEHLPPKMPMPAHRPQSWRQQRQHGEERPRSREGSSPRAPSSVGSVQRGSRNMTADEAEDVQRASEERQKAEQQREKHRKRKEREARKEEQRKQEAWEQEMRRKFDEELRQVHSRQADDPAGPSPSRSHVPEDNAAQEAHATGRDSAEDAQHEASPELRRQRRRHERSTEHRAAERAASEARQQERDAWQERQRQKEVERQRRIEQQEAERRQQAEDVGRRRRRAEGSAHSPEPSTDGSHHRQQQQHVPPPPPQPGPPPQPAPPHHGRAGKFQAAGEPRPAETFKGAAYMKREHMRSTSLPSLTLKRQNAEEAKKRAEAAALDQLFALRQLPKKERQKAFKELLRSWHPDKNPERSEVATAVFQRLQAERKNLGL